MRGCKYVNIDPLCRYVLIYPFLYDASVCVCVYAYKSACAVDQSEHITHRRGETAHRRRKKRLFLHFHINEEIC